KNERERSFVLDRSREAWNRRRYRRRRVTIMPKTAAPARAANELGSGIGAGTCSCCRETLSKIAPAALPPCARSRKYLGKPAVGFIAIASGDVQITEASEASLTEKE